MGTIPFCSPTGQRRPKLNYLTGQGLKRTNNRYTNNTSGHYVMISETECLLSGALGHVKISLLPFFVWRIVYAFEIKLKMLPARKEECRNHKNPSNSSFPSLQQWVVVSQNLKSHLGLGGGIKAIPGEGDIHATTPTNEVAWGHVWMKTQTLLYWSSIRTWECYSWIICCSYT